MNTFRNSFRQTACRSAAALGLALLAGAAQAQVAVVTHLYDTGRTGWNGHESVLTPASVAPAGAFGQLASVALDATMQAQPLVVPAAQITGTLAANGHDVVYAATEGNTVYAIDSVTGSVLVSRNLGTPAPVAKGCQSQLPASGITSTPVIDLAKQNMYLIARTQGSTGPVFTLHALDLATLADKLTPVVVSATQTKTDGTALAFDPTTQRQRPALLETNGAIYAGFGAYCDGSGKTARGWVLGWNAATLAPLVTESGKPSGLVTDHDATSPTKYFLSSVWMSGAGLAADSTGVYFTTGNSDTTGVTYDGVNNIQQSLVRASLTTLQPADLFTPYILPKMEAKDLDMSSGGVMLLPALGGSTPPLATVAAKEGTMYLLNRTSLGGYTPGGPDKVLAEVNIGQCWCAQSYFPPAKTVVSSGGNRVMLWQVKTAPAPALKLLAETAPLATGGGSYAPSNSHSGLFTTVSSNGGANPLVWAVLRPVNQTDRRVWLNAFPTTLPTGATTLPPLVSLLAGEWPQLYQQPNIVPVVANGKVYIGSQGMLTIFGLLPPAAK